MVEKQREAVWRSWFQLTPRRLCMMGVLLAMQVVMSRLFNVQLSDSLRVNLGFLPNAVAGMLMGPFCGMLVAACADLLGATSVSYTHLALCKPSGPYVRNIFRVKTNAGYSLEDCQLFSGVLPYWQKGTCFFPYLFLTVR